MSAGNKNSLTIPEIELRYVNSVKPKDRVRISSSKSAYDAFMSVWDMDKIDIIEQVAVMLLDSRGGCLGISMVATGGMMSCIFDKKVIFGIALKAGAHRLILAHNHPSGFLEPSEGDINSTKRLMKCGTYLDLIITDHLIVSRDSYHSFADYKKASQPIKWSALIN